MQPLPLLSRFVCIDYTYSDNNSILLVIKVELKALVSLTHYFSTDIEIKYYTFLVSVNFSY